MNGETPPSLRWTECGVRLLWLLPLTTAAGLHAYRLLGFIIGVPGTAAANPVRTAFELAFLAGAFWWILGRWRRTVAIARGEADLSRAWVLGRLAVVVLVGGVLVFFVVPKAREIQLLYGEVQNRDGLRLLRKALSQHHIAAGRLPDDPRALTQDARYGMPRIPNLWDTWGAGFPHHATSGVTIRREMEFTDTGAWAYIAPSAKASQGTIYVDCTHTDSLGTLWTSY